MSKRPFTNSPSDASERSDADLISDIVEGNEAAFAVLMSRHKGALYRFILRYIGSKSDAEDLLQETFLSIYAKASTYDPAWKPSTWIYRIALNKCRDHGRKQRLRKVFSLEAWAGRDRTEATVEPPDHSPSVESIVAHRQELSHFKAALETLPHNMRSALVLHTIEGRSQAECAEILGVSRKSVEMLVYRARKALQQRMGLEP